MEIRIDASSLEQLKNDADISQSQHVSLDPETVTAGMQSLLSNPEIYKAAKMLSAVCTSGNKKVLCSLTRVEGFFALKA